MTRRPWREATAEWIAKTSIHLQTCACETKAVVTKRNGNGRNAFTFSSVYLFICRLKASLHHINSSWLGHIFPGKKTCFSREPVHHVRFFTHLPTGGSFTALHREPLLQETKMAHLEENRVILTYIETLGLFFLLKTYNFKDISFCFDSDDVRVHVFGVSLCL